MMQSLSTKGKRIEDPQIVAWANSKVEGSRIRSFADPSLSTGVFLLQVRKYHHLYNILLKKKRALPPKR